MTMNPAHHSPFADFLCAGALIVVGVLMLVYRDELGALTGYFAGRGGYVDKPTPEWMLIPFALGLILGGIALIVYPQKRTGWLEGV
jgi:hypothetical protein